HVYIELSTCFFICPCNCRSFVFFFQAEDGIRDFHVTGVQTCALPIYAGPERHPLVAEMGVGFRQDADLDDEVGHLVGGQLDALRSEERRVGKEWRSWWSEGKEIKNT